MQEADAINRCIEALTIVKATRRFHASGPEGVPLVRLAISSLRGSDIDGPHGGICKAVADAIEKTYLG
jgi:hypothetical protein